MKQEIYDFDEVKDWIKKESLAGTSDEDIRKIIKDKTKWSDNEIDDVFKSLRPSSSVPAQKSSKGPKPPKAPKPPKM